MRLFQKSKHFNIFSFVKIFSEHGEILMKFPFHLLFLIDIEIAAKGYELASLY